jgi:hypothetical protein
MAEAYGWILLVGDARVRRVILLRSLIHPRTRRPFFGARNTARIFGVHTDTVAAWHRRGVHEIADQLHRHVADPKPAARACAA